MRLHWFSNSLDEDSHWYRVGRRFIHGIISSKMHPDSSYSGKCYEYTQGKLIKTFFLCVTWSGFPRQEWKNQTSHLWLYAAWTLKTEFPDNDYSPAMQPWTVAHSKCQLGESSHLFSKKNTTRFLQKEVYNYLMSVILEKLSYFLRKNLVSLLEM